MINLAKVYWGEEDISDFVISTGDFEQIFSNFDLTLKECECDMLFMDRILVSYPDIQTDTFLTIRQDNKILFHCYITEYKIDSKKHEIKVVATSLVNKLSKQTVQHFEQTYDWECDYDIVDKGGIVFKLFEVTDILKYCFKYTVGVPLYVNGTGFKVSLEMVMNAGSKIVSKDNDLREKENLITIKDLLEFVGRLGYVLFWDYTLEQFRMEPIFTTSTPPTFLDSYIYEIGNDVIVANKNTFFNYSYCSDFSQYINLTGSGEVNTNTKQTFLLNSNVYAGTEFTNPSSLCCLYTTGTAWEIDMKNSPLKNKRFYVGVLSIDTIQIPLFNTFMASTYMFNSKILSCTAVNENGRYFSELEYVKGVS